MTIHHAVAHASLLVIVLAVAAMMAAGPASAQVRSYLLSERASNRGVGVRMSNKAVTIGEGDERRTHVAWHDYTPDPGGPAAGPGWTGRRNSAAMIRTYRHASGEWSEPFTIGPGVDNHNNPALVADSRGILHVVYGAHETPLLYGHSLRPNDASAWSEVVECGERLTYASLTCDADDVLHFTARERDPDNLRRYLACYQRRPGGEWTRVARIVDSRRTEYTNFGNCLAVDDDGRLHLSFSIYAPEISAGRCVGYLTSDDGGRSWRTASGRVVDLPVPEHVGPDEVYVRRGGDIRLLNGNIALGPDGSPWVFFVERTPRRVYHPWLMHLEADGWRTIDLLPHLPESMRGRGASGVLSVTASGDLWFVTSGRMLQPGHQVALLRSTDGGASFHRTTLRSSDPETDEPAWMVNIQRRVCPWPMAAPVILYLTGGDRGDQVDESFHQARAVLPRWIPPLQ